MGPIIINNLYLTKMKKFPEPVRYRPVNPSKYVGNINEIIMRSSWESKLAFFLDSSDSVLKWGSEIKAIPYFSSVDSKVRRYFPDFWALVKQADGTEKRFIVEIKPRNQINQPKSNKNIKTSNNAMITWKRNQDKWRAAKEYAEKNGFEFLVMDEFMLGIAKR